MDLLAILLALSSIMSLTSAFKLLNQKIADLNELQKPTISDEMVNDLSTILPYLDNSISESEQLLNLSHQTNKVPSRHRRSRNLRSLLDNFRYERKSKSFSYMEQLCFFTSVPCRNLRKVNS